MNFRSIRDKRIDKFGKKKKWRWLSLRESASSLYFFLLRAGRDEKKNKLFIFFYSSCLKV
jgi:hypothetical protein